MIAVFVPVLGRPRNAWPLAESLAESTTVEHQLVWLVSPGDHEQRDACRAAGGCVTIVGWEPGPGDFARKINLGATLTSEPFLFQAADDVEFTPGWDMEALAVAERTGAGVVGTNDDANPLVRRGGHSTHSLIRRSYIDEQGASADGPGSVFSEAYGHQWCDNELVDLARARGEWAFAARSVVRHRHPIFDRSVTLDDTYLRGQASARADAALFRARRQLWAAA